MTTPCSLPLTKWTVTLHHRTPYRLSHNQPTLSTFSIRTGVLAFSRTWLRYVRLSSVVTFVRPTQGVEPFGNISSPFCTLAILWPPCTILRILSQGNPSAGGVKRKRGTYRYLCHVRVSHLLVSFLYDGWV